jgi:hypothetical protein
LSKSSEFFAFSMQSNANEYIHLLGHRLNLHSLGC